MPASVLKADTLQSIFMKLKLTPQRKIFWGGFKWTTFTMKFYNLIRNVYCIWFTTCHLYDMLHCSNGHTRISKSKQIPRPSIHDQWFLKCFYFRPVAWLMCQQIEPFNRRGLKFDVCLQMGTIKETYLMKERLVYLTMKWSVLGILCNVLTRQVPTL